MALDLARFCGDLLPPPPYPCAGHRLVVSLRNQQQPEYTPRSFHVSLWVFIYYFKEINATDSGSFPFAISCSVPCPEGFTPSGLPPGSPQLAIYPTPRCGKVPQDEQRIHTTTGDQGEGLPQ